MISNNNSPGSESVHKALREKQLRVNEIERIRAMLIEAEQSGFSQRSAEEILALSKESLKRHGVREA